MINLNNYIERIIGIYLQCRFATEAMDRLHADDVGLPEYIEWESNFISEFSKHFSSIPGVLKARYLTADIQKLSEYWTEKLRNCLHNAYIPTNQNFILMSLAIFESFLKDVHRAILFKKPKLLKTDRKLELGRLVASGYECNYGTLCCEFSYVVSLKVLYKTKTTKGGSNEKDNVFGYCVFTILNS